MKHMTHWIGGQSYDPAAEPPPDDPLGAALTTLRDRAVDLIDPARSGDLFDPATGRRSGSVDLASVRVVDEAVAVAAKAFESWRRVSLARRANILFAFRELLNSHADELAELITAEHGKVLADAPARCRAAWRSWSSPAGSRICSRASFSAGVSTEVDVYSIRQPLGVVAVISPFNFPAMVPLWFVPIAIARGNTVVLKPSEKDPVAAGAAGAPGRRGRAARRRVQRGARRQGGGRRAARRTRRSRRCRSSAPRPIARYVYETGTRHGKRVQALGGAKNHMVVLPDADLDLAADAAVNAGFGSAGERCMAISVVVAVGDVGDALVAEDREADGGAAHR